MGRSFCLFQADWNIAPPAEKEQNGGAPTPQLLDASSKSQDDGRKSHEAFTASRLSEILQHLNKENSAEISTESLILFKRCRQTSTACML